MTNVCIIGGGASGMTAAIAAARENEKAEVCLVEKKEAPGKKLLATGNGKCNMTNAQCKEVKQTLEFFASVGIVTRQDEAGQIYPYSEQAKDVVQGLRQRMASLGVEVITEYSVLHIIKKDEIFRIEGTGNPIKAKRLLLATGGKSGPQYGSTGDGYKFAKSMGHSITKLAPVLTAMITAQDMTELKGIRFNAHLKLWRENQQIAEETGQVQIIADGVSGICIFNLSRFIKLNEDTNFQDYVITIDFMPHMTQEQTYDFLVERKKVTGLPQEDLLLSVLAKPLARRLLTEVSIRDLNPEPFFECFPKDATMSIGMISSETLTLSKQGLHRLAALLKGWKLQIVGLKGWKQAQCTSGGVPLAEIDPGTMESHLVKGLYFAGELLDYDGPCGGYNLQHAWETGIKAGRAMSHV